ncbi:MAG: hypothetical protein R3E88_05015 [Myxococcota bacterium]|nr:hypothetical protein [Myxococcales bacterium]
MPRPKPRVRDARALAPCAVALVLVLAQAAAASAADPPVAPTTDDVPAEAVLADLPMLATPGSPRIHFDLAAPGDRPLPVLLDTGLVATIAPDAVLAKVGAKPLPDPGRAFERPTALGRPLAIFRLFQRDRALERSQWVRFGGMFLRDAILELDFQRRRVRFLDPAKFAIPERDGGPGRAVLPIFDLAARPRVEIQVNGHPVWVAIDTTVTVPLWLGTRDTAKAAVDPRALPVIAGGEGRGSRLRFYPTDTVKLGPFDLGLVPAIVGGAGQVDEHGASGPALGLDVLSQFKVRLDLSGHRLWLERVRTEPVGLGGLPFAHTQAAGALLGPVDDTWRVLGVWADSPAARSGFEVGDVIDPGVVGMTDAARILDAIRTRQPIEVRRTTDAGEELVRVPATPPADD